MKPLVIFAHGKESGPWGSKIKHLAGIAERNGAQVLSPDYSDLMDPDDRVKRLLELPLPAHDRLILVGSSMGGYVSTVASQALKPAGLFLLAPALYIPGYRVQNPVSGASHACVVFGWRDEVIPVECGFRFAKNQHIPLHILDGDHRLNGVLTEVGDLFEKFMLAAIIGQRAENS